MPQNLKSFLSELAVAPEKLARYLDNPDEAIREAGLDAEEFSALKSGDPAKVYASLSGQSSPAETTPQPLASQANLASGVPLLVTATQLQPPTVCVLQPQAAFVGSAPSPPPTVCVVQPIYYHALQPHQALHTAEPPEPAFQSGSQSPQSESGTEKTT